MASNFKIQNFPSLNVQVSQFPPIPMFSTFNFSSRSTILPQIRASIPFNRLHCLSLSSSTSPPSPISVSENSSNKHQFEVSYLINTFGWSPELAISKTKYLKFETPEKPERNLAFFKKHGFTETQISLMVKKLPKILLGKPEKSYLPKLEFLWSVGLSRTEVADIVTIEPRILIMSLENKLVPCFNLIRNLVQSDDEAVKIVKRFPTALTRKPEVDNVQILLEEGVPGANIAAYMRFTREYTATPDIFRKMVEKLKNMGFDPSRVNFLRALRAIRSMSGSNWKDKKQVFKKYGWSDREFLLAFEKYPTFIMSSNDKIEGVMDFLVNKMGIEATAVANISGIIRLSLEKRIVPRCLVYQSVLEKGLCKKKFSILTLCTISEDQFLTRFLKPYENEAPELWDIYNNPFTGT